MKKQVQHNSDEPNIRLVSDFEPLSAEEFYEQFDDQDEAELTYDLLELLNDATQIITNIKETIEYSNFHIKNGEKFKPHIEKLNSIINTLDDFWY